MIDYKKKLSPDAYAVCRLAATERPFTGKYNDHWLSGNYHCACCEQALFSLQIQSSMLAVAGQVFLTVLKERYTIKKI